MPSHAGPNPALDSNIVFSYDTGDTSNSYKGEPTTNYQWNNGTEFTPSYSDWTGAPAPIDVTNTSNQGPIKGAKTWQFTKNGSSNQWHGWEWTYGGIWTGNAGDIWTTSYWYKTTAPAGISSFGIGYFYKPDWSAPFNTSILANVNSIIADGQWHYNYTTTQFNENYSNAIIVDGPSWGYSTNPGVLYINGLQWEKKNHPTQFAYGTRSVSGSLLPLLGNTSLNISTVSFDSNAQIVFDGTDDYIPLSTITLGNASWTIECIVLANANSYNILSNSSGGPVTNAFGFYGNKIYYQNYDGSWQTHYGNTTLSFGTYYHFTWVNINNTMQMYVNGQTDSSIFNSYTTNGGPVDAIGRNWFSSFNGKLPIFKYYNTALSADQVKQNYQQYKSRFNLS